MLEVSRQGKKILISIDQDMISSDSFLKFIERMKVEEIAQKSRLSEEDATSIAEEIKADWEPGSRTPNITSLSIKSEIL